MQTDHLKLFRTQNDNNFLLSMDMLCKNIQFSAGQSRFHHVTWTVENQTCLPSFLNKTLQVVVCLVFLLTFYFQQQAGWWYVSASEELDFWCAVETQKGSFSWAVKVLCYGRSEQDVGKRYHVRQLSWSVCKQFK